MYHSETTASKSRLSELEQLLLGSQKAAAMGLFTSLFGNKDKKMLQDLIEHNADMIEKDEGRTRHDAEYLAICLVLDDLAMRPNGIKGHRIIMDMLSNEYSQHHNDIFTYLAVSFGKIKLKSEAEDTLRKRHQK
ncbi:MAG: hypothetical protein ACK5O1_00950 [Holosporales bacterium]|jgi:hypothetical protein